MMAKKEEVVILASGQLSILQKFADISRQMNITRPLFLDRPEHVSSRG